MNVKREFHMIRRPRYIALGDKRSPMLRLLCDCNIKGHIEPDYEQQFRTMFKAQRLGYLDKDCRLTNSGKLYTLSQRLEALREKFEKECKEQGIEQCPKSK